MAARMDLAVGASPAEDGRVPGPRNILSDVHPDRPVTIFGPDFPFTYDD
ncbi:MAG: hypothetical protein SW127_20410 [Actinomycetota bacterium]|nr:hypothetical protein [Actinomycetota bacterium]